MSTNRLKALVFLVSFCAIGLIVYAIFPNQHHLYNGQLYDDDKTASLITVIISTSPIQSMPDTKFIYESMSSLFRSPVLAKCKKIIVFDGVPPGLSHQKGRYEAYKQRILILTQTDPYFKNTELVICKEWGHLSGAVKEAMKHVTTPFVFMHQHDLKLIKDIDLNGVIATMVDNPNIKHVAFSGDTTNIELWSLWNGPVDTVIEGPHYVPLRRTFGWTDRSHVSTVDYYNNFVLPQCGHNFMEFFLFNAFQKEIGAKGHNAAHPPFGTYLFGETNDGDYVIHTDARVN